MLFRFWKQRDTFLQAARRKRPAVRLSLEPLEDRTLLSGGTPLPVAPGTVGLWHLNEGGGAVTADASGVNPAGSLVNGPQWVAGELGDALHFNGSGQFVRVKSGPVLGSAPNFTVEAWVKWDGGGSAGGQMVYCEGSYNDIVDLYLSNGVPSFTTLGANWYTASAAAPLPVGEWHFLAAVLQAGVGGSLYVDGQLAATNANMGPGSQFAGETDIGRFAGNGGSRYFPGTIDEVRVRTVAESAAEILADYQQTAGPIMTAPTTTTVAGPASATFGQTVTLTATVTPAGSGSPTGTVTFVDSTYGTSLGTQPLSGGSASVSTAGLGLGTHTITATYSGDAGFSTSAGSTSVTINSAPSANGGTPLAVAPGTAGLWHLDEGSGGTTADASGVNGPGVLVNGPQWVPGTLGNGLHFDGATQYVNVKQGPILGSAPDFTVEAWVKWDGGGAAGHQFIYAEGSYNDIIDLFLNNGVPSFTTLGANWYTAAAAAPLAPGQWHFLAGVLQAGVGGTLYVDGQAVATNPNMGAGSQYAGETDIGRFAGNGGSRYFHGTIDEVRVRTVAQSAADILADYQQTRGTPLVTLSSIAVTPAAPTLTVGQTQQFTATGTFSDGTSRTLVSGSGHWADDPAMPTARHYPAAAVINGILYVVGGNNGSTNLATLEAYDPATHTWTEKAPLPTARHGLAVAVVDGILYAMGGSGNNTPVVATVEAYNPATDTWTTKAPMSTPRTYFGAAVVDGIIYAVGGSPTGVTPLASVEAYDPRTNTWTPRAALNTARWAVSVANLDGTLYAVGGRVGSSNVATVESYDPAANAWTTKAPLPTTWGFPALGIINGSLYAVGGDINEVPSAAVRRYDPATDTWLAEAPLPAPREALAAGVIHGTLYAAGGWNGTNSVATVQEYTPTDNVTWASSDPQAATVDANGLVTAVGPGPVTITATAYGVSGSTQFTVLGQAATSTAVGVSGAATFGQAITFTAVVSAAGTVTPTGTVSFLDTTTGTDLGTANLVNGIASVTTSALHAGQHTIVASYSGSAMFQASSGSVGQQISPAVQQVAWATPAAIVYGTPLSAAQLDATVSVLGPSPAGALTYDHALGEVLDAGSYTLTVTAAATSDYLAASAQVTLVVQQATPTVTVAPVSLAFDGQPHGTTAEAFGLGGIDLGPAGVTYSTADGSAPVHAGSYTATGTFAGNNNYAPASATAPILIVRATPTVVVAPVTVTYDGQPHGTTAEVFGVNNADLGPAAVSYFGDQVPVNAGSYTANGSFDGNNDYVPAVSLGLITINQATPTVVVAPVSATYDGQPHGTIAAVYGVNNTVLGSVPVSYSSGSTPVNAGSYTATAFFGGDGNYTSASGTAAVTISPATTAIAVMSSLNPAIEGQTVTFTATLTIAAPGSGVPTGSVTFSDGGAPLATVALQWVNGAAVATYTTSALTAGNHALTAAYAGDGNFSSAASPTLTQVVQAPQQALQDLVSVQIPALVSSGALSAAQANTLSVTLNNALAKLNAGNTQAAANQVQAFINKTNALEQSGRITADEAQSLLDVAGLVLLLLS